jgi:hypothetical protein
MIYCHFFLIFIHTALQSFIISLALPLFLFRTRSPHTQPNDDNVESKFLLDAIHIFLLTSHHGKFISISLPSLCLLAMMKQYVMCTKMRQQNIIQYREISLPRKYILFADTIPGTIIVIAL